MKIVIDIEEDLFEDCKKWVKQGIADDMETMLANGTPLPKGHGDLIDISKLPVTTTYFGISDKPMKVVNYSCILSAKKIIKTDNTESKG